MNKKLLAVILGAVMLLSCVSCGKADSGVAQGSESYQPEELTLLENDSCKISVLSLTWPEGQDAELILQAENKTEQPVSVSGELLSVNRFMMPQPAPVVVNGKESQQIPVTIAADRLAQAEITSICEAGMVLDINEADNGDRVVYEPVSFTIGEQQKTESAETPGTVILDTDSCLVSAVSFCPDTDQSAGSSFSFTEESGKLGYGVLLYLQNKEEADVSFAVLGGSVNGVEASITWMEAVSGSCGAYAMLVIPYDKLQSADYVSGTEIQLDLNVNLLDTYEELYSGSITATVK